MPAILDIKTPPNPVNSQVVVSEHVDILQPIYQHMGEDMHCYVGMLISDLDDARAEIADLEATVLNLQNEIDDTVLGAEIY